MRARLSLSFILLAMPWSAAFAASDASMVSPQFEFREDQPILMIANEMGYDKQADTVIAAGNVEISQGETILLADRVTYDQTRDIITATGSVSVLEPSSNVYFADEVQLKDQMNTGSVSFFKARLTDGSLVTAREGTRVSETVTTLEKAIYTPCSLICKDGSPKNPTWAITASKVNIDTQAQEISYNDAWMEFSGVPMLYAPRFSHPTPGADNKSGFLSPTLRRDDNLGTVFQMPYYYVIGQDQDLTLTPILTTLEGPVLFGEYRKQFDRGKLDMTGSFTIPKDRDASGALASGRTYRGHVDGEGRYEIDPNWSTGFTLRRATDDTYLSRYGFNWDSLLTSRAYVEGENFFNNGNKRHYATLQTLHFQGLTAQDSRERTPFVFPLAEFGYMSDRLMGGSRLSLTTNMMALTRDEGAESRRFATLLNWNLPYVTSGGHIFELDTSIRADIYDTSNHTLTDGSRVDGVYGRFVPQVSTTWSYPLMKQMEDSTLTIEPIANITFNPNGSNPDEIPNEDSAVPEFTDANVFSSNRYSGWDRVESGARTYYGFRSFWDFYQGQQLAASLGQAYRLNDSPQFPVSNDLTSRLSDYVGRLALQYQPVNLSYRFRLDKDDLSPRRSEVEAGLNFKRFGIGATYLYFDNDPIVGDSQEIVNSGYIRLTDNWMLNINTRRDLERARQTSAGIGLLFENECLTLSLGGGRDLTNDRDLQASTSLYARIFLKNLN